MPGRRDLAQQLEARIRSLPGVEEKKSRWMNKKAYYVGSREFAHFHNNREIDVRLTRKLQTEHADRIRNDSRVKFRDRPSEWIALSLSRTEDVNYAFEMVKLALEANRVATRKD